MLFAAVHESLVGPTRTCWHVRYCAAIGRQADIERALIAALGTCATCGRCSDPRRLCQTVSTLLGLARKSGLSSSQSAIDVLCLRAVTGTCRSFGNQRRPL